jgi:hypothetical protein
LLLALCLALGLAASAWAGPAPEGLLEELHYRIDVLLWQDAARVRLTLKRLEPGRYQAEISGEPQGMLKRLSGQRRDSYQTDMVWRDGRLMPVVYREQSLRRGKKYLKEYRFDYAQGRLALWQWKEGKGMARKWEEPLSGLIYDPLSAFYNCRLGIMGPVREGATFKIAGIPYPKPEEIEVRIGGETQEGLKAMVSIVNQVFHGGRGEIYAYLDGDKVPKQAWTMLFGYGKISGELLPGSKTLKESLAESPRTEVPLALAAKTPAPGPAWAAVLPGQPERDEAGYRQPPRPRESSF